ncbi:NAD-dependent protein deacetylase hst2-1 [Paramyrothecium foliicola]|nr:NAD-dependent protein deacetylase hst2-1 [Paramyrothecium foliicola]
MSDHEFGANDDLSLPKATVQKIVTEILPPSAGVAFAKEARDLLIECCVEFITLISSEANEISEKEAKKTIACDHITKALEQLGFSDYVPAVLEAAAEHKEVQKGREKKADKFANSGMSMEELARLQEEQFAQARERHTVSNIFKGLNYEEVRLLGQWSKLMVAELSDQESWSLSFLGSHVIHFMRKGPSNIVAILRSCAATIGRRRRDRRKPGPRVPRWSARKMGQEESLPLVDDSVPPNTLSARSLAAVADYIKSGKSKRVVVLTGAGISTAAGIPDFRSPKTGLYSNLARLNLPYPEAVFDISFFRENGAAAFYVLAKELYPGKFFPTISHAFIALLAKKGLLHMLFTQNIDCLERRAGVPADKIIEAHGSFATQRCIECKTEFPEEDMKDHVTRGEVPHCKESNCNGLVKPDIVFFGEQLPKAFDHNAHQTALADLVLIIGTSLSVYPFASLPDMAKQDAPRVLFNMERVGQLGRRPDDVLELGPCDEGIRKLADELGWKDDLERLWRGLVGDEEAERQLKTEITYEASEDDEVENLAREVDSALRLDDATEQNDASSELLDKIRQHLEGKVEQKTATTEATTPGKIPEVPTLVTKEDEKHDPTKATQEKPAAQKDSSRDTTKEEACKETTGDDVIDKLLN